MTSTDQPRLPRTVADLVLDDRTGDDPGRPIVDDTTRSPHGLLDKLSASGCRWIRRQVLAKLKELLGDNLADVLMSAWATGGDIARAARETAEDPTAERLVLVHEQQVGWARDLTISLVFDERLSTDFQGRVTVTFELGRIEAVVRGGWLMGVNYDHCAVTCAPSNWRATSSPGSWCRSRSTSRSNFPGPSIWRSARSRWTSNLAGPEAA